MHCDHCKLSTRLLIVKGLHAVSSVTRASLIVAISLLAGALETAGTSIAQETANREPISADILLRGGTVIDGTGTGAQKLDVAIRKGKLVLPTPSYRTPFLRKPPRPNLIGSRWWICPRQRCTLPVLNT